MFMKVERLPALLRSVMAAGAKPVGPYMEVAPAA